MNLKIQQSGSRAIVYDADCIDQPGEWLFDPVAWRRRGAVVGEARGRGHALMLETPYGPAVLRPYLRGGWAARITSDRYVYLGFRRTRPYREMRILERLTGLGLPVPRPLAGSWRRSGAFYRGALLTRRIERALPLAELLGSDVLTGDIWRETGRVIRWLHRAGVVHADLNARNILVGDDGQVHLLDFDRARVAPGAERHFQANLERLHRSLVKWWPPGGTVAPEAGWLALREGYGESSGRPPGPDADR